MEVAAQPPMLGRRSEFDMRISLYKLEILCLVIELGGVTRAAKHLHVAQPVITAHMRSLEERLGVTIFVKSGRQIELTEAGRRVHLWAAETVTRTRTMLREVGGMVDGHRGAAFVAANPSIGSYVLPSVLTRFQAERPDAQITLAIREQQTVVQSVEQGECDFGIVVFDASLDLPELELEHLADEEVVLVTAPDGPPNEDTIELAELSKLPMLGPPRGLVRGSLISGVLASLGSEPSRAVLELGHPEAIKRATREGFGVALMLRSAVEDEIARGELRRVHFSDVRPTVAIHAIKRAEQPLSALQAQLLDAIRQHLRSHAREPLDDRL